MAAKKKAAKKKAAAKKESTRVPFGSDIRLKAVKENPRREGTAGHKRFASMMKFVAANKGATLAEVVAKTDYKSSDYAWDNARKVFG